MIALSPKCYTSWNNWYDTYDDLFQVKLKENALKCKGVSLRQNKHINYESYKKDVMEKGLTVQGQNYGLQLDKTFQMSRTKITKTALTGKMTKGITLQNGVVLPFIH